MRGDIGDMIMLDMRRVRDNHLFGHTIDAQLQGFFLKHRKTDVACTADNFHRITPAIRTKMPETAAGRDLAFGVRRKQPLGCDRIFGCIQALLIQRLPLHLFNIPE